MNTIHKVGRKNGANLIEPNAVIIRTAGTERSKHHHDPTIRKEMMKLTNAEEILTFSEMSRRNLCPMLIGIFEGGRVEEFRKMHSITSEEVLMPQYMEDIAKSFARMHSLKLPLSKKEWDPFWERAKNGYKARPHTEWLKDVETDVDLSYSLSLDYCEETLWLNKVREKYFNIRSRDAFIQADTHYMNLVVNEEPRQGELNVYLLDYELCSYGPRGLDLGAHFLNRVLDFGNEGSFLSGERMHTEEERRQFLKYYQDELRTLGSIKDFDDQGLDSIDNLLFESYIGALLYHVFFNYIAFNLTPKEQALAHPMFLNAVSGFSYAYCEAKKLAIEKYPFIDPKVI